MAKRTKRPESNREAAHRALQSINQEYDPAYPVDKLIVHPDNPRRGNLELIRQSIEVNGFYGVVLVQKGTNRIIGGNHRYMAAVDAGYKTVPVIFLDEDDISALRIMLADNRTSDVATYDLGLLTKHLQALGGDDESLKGTGYTKRGLEEIMGKLSEPDAPESFPEADLTVNRKCPKCGYEWKE